ncbi:protein terminal ear1 [Eutrema salsugineum]|uniref:protein terminal ear1 n=1 Tax=Eutrema salsugineum TaxID=72664 RepID=UPI000CED0633|nr:protein terminal ear1 [Eutrema salsugineum]
MASPNSPDHLSPARNDGASDVIVRRTLNPTAPFFFPRNLSLHRFYFSPPPIYFISETNLPPPPSIFLYYPLNINPNPFVYVQEMPHLYLENPSQELSSSPTTRKGVFGRRGGNGHCKKVTWKRKIHHQVESIGDHLTTVMLRNIPNKYTRDMMIEFLDEHCEVENKKKKDEEFPVSAYDFLYLPIDFMSKMNKGYAFVNFTNAEAVSKFKAACNHKAWCHFGSKKVLEVAHARLQANELVKHFEQMTYPVEAYSAVCFSPARSGPKNTVETIMVGKCTEPMIRV